MGEDENSIIQVKTETKKDKGAASPSLCWLFFRPKTAIGNAEAMTRLLAGCWHQRDRHDLRAALAEQLRPPALRVL